MIGKSAACASFLAKCSYSQSKLMKLLCSQHLNVTAGCSKKKVKVKFERSSYLVFKFFLLVQNLFKFVFLLA